MSWLTRLYPKSWRARYGREFDVLMEDVQPSWSGTLDVLRSAMWARFQQMDWRFAGAFALTGLLLACVMTWRAPDRFTSSAELRLRSGRSLAEKAHWLRSAVLSRSSLDAVMREPLLDLYAAERQREPIEDVIARMKALDLKVEITGREVPVLRISYTGPDAWRSQRAVQSLLTHLIDENLRRARPASGPGVLEVLQPPNLPDHAVRPQLWKGASVGLLLGLAAFFALAAIRRVPRAIFCGVLAGMVAALLSYAIPRSYVSSALVHVDSPQTGKLLRTDVPGVRLEAGAVPEERIVTARASNNREAQRLVEKALFVFMDPRAGWRQPTTAIDVIDPPSLPMHPVTLLFPLEVWFLLAGGVAGLTAGLRLKLDRPRNNPPSAAYKPA